MLHYLGGPRSEDGSYVHADLTKERLRQLATARLAEQGRRVMQEANFLFQQQEAAAAMQRNVTATVASKPLYPIAAPQRMKLPKHQVRFPDPRLNPNKQYEGPLNLVNRPVQSGRPYAAIRPSPEECVVDLSKPLDLSMKSIERQQCVVSRGPPVMDPRLISMSMANAGAMVGKSHGLCSNGRGVASAVTTTQSVYRPPPMMSFGKPGRRGNLLYSTPSNHYQHPLLAKDMPQISQGQLHPLVSTTVDQHIQPSRTALKRPAPVLAHAASGIPTKRTVHEKNLNLDKEFSKVTPSSSIPMSANMQQQYEATRAAYLDYELKRRSHAASLITQQNKSSSLRITDVRSTARSGVHPIPTSTASRPRSKAREAPVFHHIHHHLHHHHVPQPEEELLLSDSNGATAVQVPPEIPSGVLTHDNVLPKNGRPLPVREIQIHRLANHGLSSHDMKTHDIVTEPNLSAAHRDRVHGVLIKHTTGTPTAAVTSPHLKRAHYRTRRRYREISPPTLVSIAGIPTLSRDAPSVVSTPGRPHQPNRAASPLRLVASSFTAGAKMNEILKPLDEPDHQPSQGVIKNTPKKLLMSDSLARPLRVDIPDDRAFVSHLGGVYTGQANPVPLVRQVANVANITKCLTSEASSSPKKANSSGNESPTMPVLTPQSVYSPCPLPPSFTSESAATSHPHKTSTTEHTSASSPVFYNALTLPLYPLNKDASTEVSQKISRLKNNSPPNLQEKSPEQQVPDQRVPDNIDPDQADSDPDRIAAYRERNRVNSELQRQIDKYLLDATSKADPNKPMQRRYNDRGNGREYSRETLEDIDKGRKGHMHQYSLKASLDKLKSKQPKKDKHLSHAPHDSDDRNIFAQFMLQRQWYGNKTKAKLPEQRHCDVIDLTTSPSLSPAPDILKGNTGINGVSGGIPEQLSETPPPAFRGQTTQESMLQQAILEGKSVSVSDAIDAAFAGHIRDFSCVAGNTERKEFTFKKQSVKPELKDSLRRLSEHQTSQSAVPSSFGNTCPVITSAKTSSMVSSGHPSEDVFRHGVPPHYSSASSLSTHSSQSFFNGSISSENLQTVSPCRTGGGALSTSAMTSSTPSLSQMRYSPTEKTFSHDPRKKLLAAMSYVHMPPGVACSISPVSVAASLNSTVSPSSGRSTPSKSSARKRSLEMLRLENTSSYVAEIPKRRGHVDLLTDPSLLDREERALQRAMKQFNEMEQKEKLTPTGSQSSPNMDPQAHRRHPGRVLTSKQSPTFRSGKGRGRKIRRLMRIQQKFKDDFSVSALKARRSFSREMRRLTSTISRPSFHDFVPTVLEDRTRHSLATRSSARERKAPYHKNARYEMEIEKEERKVLERKRHKRSVSRSTSGDEEPNSPKTKTPSGRRRKGSDAVFKTSGDKTIVVKEEPLTESNDVVQQTNQIENKPDPAQLEGLVNEEGVAMQSSMDMDTPLHVVLDPTNRIKMKFMTPSAFEMHQKDSGKENDSGKKKPGGKRKSKTKNVSSAVVAMETDVQQEENTIVKTEVAELRTTETPPPLPEPIPVKIVRPNPPFELKRLMVNKKLGETVLHRAARLSYDDVAVYCIDYDVIDINAKDNAGYTPLHECCVHGRLSVARYLLEHGADVNASASDGTRPIHDAVDNNWLELVRMLLAYGADPLIATYSGRTTIKLARTKAMKTFIIGYLRDVNGDWELDEEDPYQSNLDLSWSLDGEYSFDEHDNATVDIFQGIPEVKKVREESFLLEMSDTPHLTTYNIRLANTQRARNWLLLSDVTRQLDTSRMEFLACNRTLRRATMTRHDFIMATEHSQLNRAPSSLMTQTSRNSTVELLELTSDLRHILHIEEDYI
ncbi:uncharacterized protein [Asterias amurensis]